MPYSHERETVPCTICCADANIRVDIVEGNRVDCWRCGDFHLPRALVDDIGVLLRDQKARALASYGAIAARSAEGPSEARAGSDHRSGSSAGAARGEDRLGLSRPALCVGVRGGTMTAGPADAARGRALHPEAHAQSLRRGAVRALAEEPLITKTYFCSELSFCQKAAVRALVANAVAAMAWRD